MGGAAVAAERQREGASRNAEIGAVMRSAVDAFQLALSKQIRDGVRAAEQGLYACLADGVEHQVRLLSAEATATRRVAEATEHTDRAVADIDADLSSVHTWPNRALRMA
jgi:hypothetical protein